MYLEINDQTPMTTLMAIYQELCREEHKHLSDHFNDPNFAKTQTMELRDILGNPSLENPVPIVTIFAVRGQLLATMAILEMGRNEQLQNCQIYKQLKINLQNAAANMVYLALDSISTIIEHPVDTIISTGALKQRDYAQLVKIGKEVVLSTAHVDYISLRIIDILEEFQRNDGLVNFYNLSNRCNILYEYFIDYFDDPYEDNHSNEDDNDRRKLKELHRSQVAFFKASDDIFKNIVQR